MGIQEIDINCDLGEVELNSGENIDHLLMPYLSSCNIACGGHAGDLDSIRHTMDLARMHRVAIGIHPSYPDKENFGRKSMDISLQDLRGALEEQISNCIQIAKSMDLAIHHIKPHGALYNDLVKQPEKAEMFIRLMKDLDSSLLLYGLANTDLADRAVQAGIPFIHEVFADRAYANIHSLRSRSLENSVFHSLSDIEKRIASLITRSSLILYDGTEQNTKADSICVHSDTQGSEKALAFISNYLKKHKVDVRPC